jgi:predicted esterase
MNVHTIETRIHGRYLHEDRGGKRLLAGFHGYAERAEHHFEELHKIVGTAEWSIASIQGLRTFYTRSGDVVSNWMTSQDREFAIADNLAYVEAVLHALPKPETLVFAGFSQGASMAARAAAHIASAGGLIMLGGDIPPDVMTSGVRLPPTLLGRGLRDDWYSEEKFKNDLRFLRETTQVTECVFDGGHEWTDEFRSAAADFLKHLTR